jgi:hypothetical protein
MSIIDNAVAYMVDLVTDPKHGYDQINRWGPNYDCSSSIIQSWDKGAGIPVKAAGASYTGNMRAAFKKCGFTAIPYKKGMSLVKGDVILNERHHTVMYIGDGKIAQFSINEKGNTKGGKTGDQTGKESSIGKFYEYSKGWDYVLRYTGGEIKQEDEKVNITLTVLKQGSKGPEVKSLQILLYANGYNCGTADGVFGSRTDAALRNLQKARGLKVDGVCGKCTWTSILTA